MDFRHRHSSSAYEIGSLTGLSCKQFTNEVLGLESAACCKGVYEDRNYLLLIFGGKNGSTISNSFYSCQFNYQTLLSPFDFLEIKIPETLTPRYGCTLTTWTGGYILFGGRDDKHFFNETYFISPDLKFTQLFNSNDEEIKSSLPPERAFHTLTYINKDTLLLYGGCNETGTLSDMYMLKNPKDPKWEKINPLANEICLPGARSQHTMSLINNSNKSENNNVILIGGTDGTTIFDDIYSYNLLTNQWIYINISDGSLLYPLYGHTALSVNHIDPITGDNNTYILIEGGKSEDGNNNGMMLFNVNDNTLESIVLPQNPPFRYNHISILVEDYYISLSGKINDDSYYRQYMILPIMKLATEIYSIPYRPRMPTPPIISSSDIKNYNIKLPFDVKEIASENSSPSLEPIKTPSSYFNCNKNNNNSFFNNSNNNNNDSDDCNCSCHSNNNNNNNNKSFLKPFDKDGSMVSCASPCNNNNGIDLSRCSPTPPYINSSLPSVSTTPIPYSINNNCHYHTNNYNNNSVMNNSSSSLFHSRHNSGLSCGSCREGNNNSGSNSNNNIYNTYKVIKINVGGTIYETTRETVEKEPQSILAELLPSNYINNSSNNCNAYYDRDSCLFSILLQYLRTNQLVIDNSDALIENILNECDYYKFNKLKSGIINQRKNKQIITKSVKNLECLSNILSQGYSVTNIIPEKKDGYVVMLKPSIFKVVI